MSWLSHAFFPYARRRSRKNIWMIKSTADPGRSTRAMCYRVILVSFLGSLWLIPQTVRAQTLYWDNTNVANEKVESAMSLNSGTERACMVAEETMNTAKTRDPFARYEKL
jgi:hypothetical protein